MQDFHELISAKTSSIDSTKRGGNHGLLVITQEPAKYLTLTGHVFMSLTNPKPVHETLGGAIVAQVEALENTHKHNLQEYHEHKKASKSLMQQLISALEPQCIRQLNNLYTVFNKTTVTVSCKHPHDTCRMVTAFDLNSNAENMKTLLNKDEPLEIVFDQIENVVLFGEQCGASHMQHSSGKNGMHDYVQR